MDSLLQIASHVVVTVIAVVALALRFEHRLTRMETDLSWIKDRLNEWESGDCDNETKLKGR